MWAGVRGNFVNDTNKYLKNYIFNLINQLNERYKDKAFIIKFSD